MGPARLPGPAQRLGGVLLAARGNDVKALAELPASVQRLASCADSWMLELACASSCDVPALRSL